MEMQTTKSRNHDAGKQAVNVKAIIPLNFQ
jgi:hypothetical protein